MAEENEIDGDAVGVHGLGELVDFVEVDFYVGSRHGVTLCIHGEFRHGRQHALAEVT
jgi:hypothetical protein